MHKDKDAVDSPNQEGLISGNAVNLAVKGNLTNSGTIQSNTTTNLIADNVQNLGGTITGNRVNVKANTDINNIGGQIKGVDALSLSAGRNITIASTSNTQTNQQGSLTNISSVAGLSVTGEQGKLNMNAGQDINLTAAKIENFGTNGTTTIAAGQNINLNTITESQNNKLVWDKDNHRTDSKTVDVGTTIQAAGAVRLQAGQDINAKAANIEVGKNTDLKGAVIASTATPDKNKISTGTITYSDIQNKADYDSSSIGVNYATGADVAKKDQELTPNIGVTASGDADSTTKSAISSGKIDIRSNPNQDLSGLSRDPSGSLNALGKIFDKKTVQEQQELAKVFSEEAFKYVGELAAKKQVEGTVAKE